MTIKINSLQTFFLKENNYLKVKISRKLKFLFKIVDLYFNIIKIVNH